MSGEIFFTIEEIAHQLGVGVSTVKFWVKRYSRWLSAGVNNNNDGYPEEALEIFQLIAECTASGMEIAKIERVLTDITPDETVAEAGISSNDTQSSHKEPPYPGTDGSEPSITDVLKTNGVDTILSQILDQQKKIATAQERRAAAEERKAFALESRTEAELLKANVMQELLTVFKQTTVQPSVSSLMEKIQQMPAPSPSETESPNELDYDFTDNLEDLPELKESTSDRPSIPPSPEPEIIDAQVEPPEIKNKKTEQEAVQTDSILNPAPAGDTSEQSDVSVPDDMDDLSLLIDKAGIESIDDIDDLSLLIENAAESRPDDDMDDLSLLVETVPDHSTEAVDDLSALIAGADTQPETDMDDLSLLLEDTGVPPDDDMDDLSLLIEITGDKQPAAGETPSTPAAPPPAPVKQHQPQEKTVPAENHKSMVLSKIIKLKEKEGLSIEEATKRLNDDQVKTLSGKGLWDTKTITGIYKYIDSGKKKK